MKQVSIQVVENGVTNTISISYSTREMPIVLDDFIKDHLGGRPDDRK